MGNSEEKVLEDWGYQEARGAAAQVQAPRSKQQRERQVGMLKGSGSGELRSWLVP